MDGSVVALQQHLTDTGGTAEVTVNLEGRMGVEQVGVGATVGIFAHRPVVGQQMKHVPDDAESVVAVEHAGPEVDLPTETPARSHVTTLVQSVGSSREEVGVGVRRNLIRGIESIEVGDMAVLVLGVVTILHPLL